MNKAIAIVTVLVICSFLGCKVKNVQSGKATGNIVGNTLEQASAIVSSGLTEDKTNIYINGQKVNYYSDKIDLIRNLLGPSVNSKAGSIDSQGHVTYMYDDFGKIKVSYNTQNGKIGNIIVDSPSYPIELGGKVGDTRETVTLKYQCGFYKKIDNIEQNDCYYYFRMAPNNETGIGFRFFFGPNNIVNEIVIGGWSFAE